MSARNAMIRGSLAAFSVVLAWLGTGFTWPSRAAEEDEPNKVALLVGINNELVGRLPGNSAIPFGCSTSQQALDHEKAGGGHGIFFHQVIEGLRGAAADAETGEVGWDDLVGYVRKCVNRLARELDPEGAGKADERSAGNLQTPQKITNLVATPILAQQVKPREPAMPRPADVPKRDVPGLDTVTTKTAGITLKRIPAGAFQMGSPDGIGRDEEHPQHEVRITRPFYLDVTEVTQAQYEVVMGINPSYYSATGDGKDKVAGQSTGQHPVEEVSWLDAVKFCNKLSELEGRKPFYEIDGETVRVPDWRAPGYRLPTEAEWEYACAGAPGDLAEFAWSDMNSSRRHTRRWPETSQPVRALRHAGKRLGVVLG